MKSCNNPECKQVNPQPLYNFYAAPLNVGGVEHKCKWCKLERQKKGRKKPSEPVLDWDKIMAAKIPKY